MTNSTQYPFAEEFITDGDGQITKVILDFAQYQQLLEALEDKGIYAAMSETVNETPLDKAEALALLDAE